MKQKTNITLIAPCGMNCQVCYVYLREKNSCCGCQQNTGNKPKSCTSCKIKTCVYQQGRFCYKCTTFPCSYLKQFDKRYQKNYGVSLIDNLIYIRDNGVEDFLYKEEKKWICSYCNKKVSIHWKRCEYCEKEISKVQ